MTIVDAVTEKYKRVSKPAKASFWLLFASIVQKGISLFTTPIFTRILTTEEYGGISVYYSWLNIISIVATFELATGVYNKAMIKYDNDRDGYTSSTMILSTIITLILFWLYWINRTYWNSILKLNTAMMIMLFAEIFFSISFSFWSIRKRFDFEYKSVVWVTLSANTLGTILSIVLVLICKTHRTELRILGALLVNVAVYTIIYISILRKGKKIVVYDYWKYAILYNAPLIPHYLSQQILNQADRIMISRMIDNSSAAIYTVAYQISIVLNIITNAVHASFTPWAFRKIKEHDFKVIGNVAFKLELFMCCICFFFALFSPEVILVLGGKTYYEAIWVVPPVVMSVVFNMIYSLISNIAFYYEKTGFIMFGTVFSALANIALNYYFIGKYGYLAAGYTTLACFIIYSIMHFLFMIYICRKEGIDSPFEVKQMFIIALLASLFSIIVIALYHYTYIRYILIIIISFLIIVYREKLLGLIKKSN